MKRRSRSNPSCKRPTYWGRGGAGMMFICTEDATVLLLLRASWVMQGGTWGVAGGGIEEGYVNTPIQDPILDDARYLKAAVKETEEECGSLPPGFRMTQVVGQTEYEDCGFRYVTFVADITKAQKTAWKLDSSDGETDAFRWVPLARVKPGAVIDGHALHFGVEFTLTHPEYARIVQGEVRAVANPRLRKVVAAAQGRRARRNEGAPAFRDLAFEPIPKIPDSKRVSLDFKNGHYLTIAGAPSFPDQGDGTSTWALQVTEGGRSYSLMQQTREQVEALIARLAAKPATDDYLQRHDYPAYQERLRVRHAEAEGKRKAAEDAAHKALMTPKFRKWFGKSKVVDKQGRPLKVYHGSREAGFHAFDTSSQVKPGFFFTNDVAMARSYTPRNTDVQLPYFRTLKEVLAFEETSEFPLNLEKKDGGYDVYFDGSYLGFYGRGETKDMLAEINSQSTSYPGVYEVYLRIEDPFEVDGNGDNWDSITITDDDGDAQTLTTNDISNMAQDMGHDGVIIRDVTDAGGHGRGSESGDVYIAFDPNQIKSTQNIGSYSRDTDDLRLNPRKPRKARKARSSRRGR